MKKLLPLPLCAALLLAGCNGPGTTTEVPATPEAQLTLLQDSLNNQHERLMNQDELLIGLAARLNATPKPPRPLLARISAADNAMMSWMHGNHDNAPDSTAPVAQQLAYFQAQQRQLAQVAHQITSVLDSARAAAAQLPPDSAATRPTPKMQMKM